MRRSWIIAALAAGAAALGGCYYETYPGHYADTYYVAGSYYPYGYGFRPYRRYPYYGHLPPPPHHVLGIPAPHHLLPVPPPHHW